MDLKPLYKDSAKVKIIDEICERLLNNLFQFSSYEKVILLLPLILFFYKNIRQIFLPKDSEPEPPTTILWLYYYLGQHYDYKQDYENAFAVVEKAIEHTPTLIELFLLKGKLYKVFGHFSNKNYYTVYALKCDLLKHVGDMESAVECLEEAQSLDTADRYINCKCAKYMLRANKVRKTVTVLFRIY